ncbi:MAG: ROK family protein [Deltaproteobacteria bacterium]|nr:ROK family protein [Deltaproteobacteria bacterium]
MSKLNIAVGVDIGGTNTSWGFVDEQGSILAGGSFETCADEPADKLIDRLAKAIKSDFITIEQDKLILKGIGIGAPNANYIRGTIEHPPNFDWEVVNFVEMMKEHFDLPVVITNDANAAAVGEMIFGKAQQLKDFVVITLGTGIGSGIITGGNLLLGNDSIAGELGHITAEPGSDRKCGCGKYGCLETFASATGIVKTAKKLLAHQEKQSSLRVIQIDQLASSDIGKAAQKGDKLALEAFDITAKVLGAALANTAAILSPQAFFLFGGLANAGDLILKPVKQYMEENLPFIFKDKVDVQISGLQDKNAAILGAAALILQSEK